MRKLQKRINPSRAGGEISEETKGMFRSWFLAVQTPLTTKRTIKGRGEGGGRGERGREGEGGEGREEEGEWEGEEGREGEGKAREGRGSTRTVITKRASLVHHKLHNLKAMQYINTSTHQQMNNRQLGRQTYGSGETEDCQYDYLRHNFSIDGPLQLASLGPRTTVV